eukprot:gene29769-30238_t
MDARLPEFVAKLKDGDLCVITADHGCDPTSPGSDHTREHIPMIFFGPGVQGRPLGISETFSDIGQTLAHHLGRTEAMALDLSWLNHIHVNKAAAYRRAASLANRRSVKKEYQAAWLVKALQCIDLTTLSGDDTPGRVHRLCAKAKRPLRDDIVAALGLAVAPTVGAVCVYPSMVPPA